MLPIYRERDRVADIAERNKITFDECNSRLRNNAVICIFPEGSHRGKKQLVPLKKGTSRMVIDALDAGLDELCIVPVGLDYENYYSYRKNLLLRFGKPIELNGMKDLSTFDRAKMHTVLTEKIREALSAIMIDIRTENVYHEIMFLKPLCDKIYNNETLISQFEVFKKLTVELDGNANYHAHLNHDVGEFISLSHDLRIHEDLYEEQIPFLNKLVIYSLVPLVLLCALFFYPIYYFTESTVNKIVKDPLFKNSIRLCLWTFITPAWLLLLFFVGFICSADIFISSILTLSLFIGGVVSLFWWRGWKKLQMLNLCNCYHKNGNLQFVEWKEKRTTLLNWIIQLNQSHK